jgi:L-asparagine transporter-like permease
MSQPTQTAAFAVRGLEAKRALHKAQRDHAAFHQSRLAALEGVGIRGMTVLSLMISVAALLSVAMPLSTNGKYGIVLASVVGAFAVILPMVSAARSRARRVNDDYLRESRELFPNAEPLELVCWLLDQPRRAARSRGARDMALD